MPGFYTIVFTLAPKYPSLDWDMLPLDLSIFSDRHLPRFLLHQMLLCKLEVIAVAEGLKQ